MASISIDPSGLCIDLNCGAGESVATFSVQDIYEAWKNWAVISDNAKYPQAMASTGGDPLGGGERLGAAFFLFAGNGWKLCPVTVEIPTKIVLDGNLFADPAGADLVAYGKAAGCVFVEIRTSALPTLLETGGSALTPTESSKLMSLPTSTQNATAVWTDEEALKIKRLIALIPAAL